MTHEQVFETGTAAQIQNTGESRVPSECLRPWLQQLWFCVDLLQTRRL